ncbi:GTPase ObgE [Geovibrio thiophilus]|uniref:GTPase Obg n=1 Tax=Geovibrio thiophilus TaxID=139438 RepID=A0A3R5UXJ7_9BACT|nr:GTPase ObgE [Geovibrio thiophilus]QAR32239.1 GTPase ObgE [Geovibrio thiophilus]
MKFVDSLIIDVEGGHGGNGCCSFRREAYVPRGGPNGGNGGNGGNVILEGDDSKTTLLDLTYNAIYKAKRGVHGKGSDLQGKRGEDILLKVPVGTMIYETETEELIADITQKGEQVIVAAGGRGGRGNASFVSSTHRAPREHTDGEPGEKKRLRLELKLIADVGIIGMPNAGKSTFISTVSAAKPKVADYPFTTLVPNLGVVRGALGEPFVLADMPGLVEGAHEGTGLGMRFLRHIERTRVLVHFVDSSDYDSTMVERYSMIRNELEKYGIGVSEKAELVAATKTDAAMPENLIEFEEFIKKEGKPFFKICSLTKDGVKELLDAAEKILAETEKQNEEDLGAAGQ